MTSPAPPTVPVTVGNPGDWEALAATIAERTGVPPPFGPDALGTFVGQSVQLLVEADNAHSADVLRANFASPVIAQLLHYAGSLVGCTAQSVTVELLGAPHDGLEPVVRIAVRLALRERDGRPGVRQHFWEVQLADNLVTVGAAVCPTCGAPVASGALVCPYCHADTRRTTTEPFLVVKLERLS
jgi:hypothetical protein